MTYLSHSSLTIVSSKNHSQAILLLAMLVLSGCARQHEPQELIFEDKYEAWNREVLKFNDSFDEKVYFNISKVYKAIPTPFRMGVSNFFSNAAELPILINTILQGDLQASKNSFMRLAVNTTFGIGGLFEMADRLGYARKRYDFGQTMYLYGYNRTNFVILPFIGPSSFRDSWGIFADRLMNPIVHMDNLSLKVELTGLDLFDTKIRVSEYVKALPNPEYAKDRYLFLKDTYIQNRRYFLAPPQNWDNFYEFETEKE